MKIFFSKTVLLFSFFLFITCIKLNAQCTASFTADTVVCVGEKDSFINNSSGAIDSSIWIWSAGVQSVTIGTRGISHVFASAGTYNVMLIVRGDSSCYDSFTLRITVRINPTAPAFTISPSSSVCAGTPIRFAVTSPVSGQTYSWRFGDGASSSATSISHTYSGYGSSAVTYFDTLTTTLNGCSTTTTSSVSVLRKPDAILGAGSGVFTTVYEGLSTFYKCAASGSMSTRFSFTNLSTITSGVTSTISWGDGSADTTITVPFSSISHTYARGYYFLTFITRNALGCSDTARYRVFYGSNPSGGILGPGSTDICGPDSLTFYLSRFSTNTPGTVYTITFNDGSSPLVFSHPPPDSITHVFTRSSCGTTSSDGMLSYPNAFAANIVISNPCGVTSGSVVPIRISLPPVANFSVSPSDTICVGTRLVVNNTSTSGSMSSASYCDSSINLLWSISPSTGWTVSSGSMGSDEGFPSDPTSWTSGTSNINFNFTVAGSYQVKLVIGNGCGSDTMTRYVCVVASPDAAFTLPTHTGCAPLRVPITNTSALVSSCSVVRYNWVVSKIRSTCVTDSSSDYFYYAGTSASSFAPSIQFNNEGSYTIRLQAINVCGTVLSRLDTVVVKRKPEANIVVPDSVCLALTISPTISGLKSCGDSILSYAWLFSGGSPASSSAATPGTVSFASIGAKTISLSVVNSCGTVARTKTIYVIAPPTANAGRDSFFCSGGSYQLGTSPIGGNTYAWSPTTGLSSGSVANPILTLTNSDTIPHLYTYVLTVSNSLRCLSYDTVVITVNPIPRLVVSPSPAVICAGSSVTLTASGANTYSWSPSTGLSATTGSSVTANPSVTTVYTITGQITSTGCSASIIDTVRVNPLPIISPASTQTICSGTTSTSITHSGSISGSTISWTSVATGVTGVIPTSGTGSIPIYTLVNSGSTIGMVVFTVRATASGCVSLPVYDTIYVNPTPIATIALPYQVLCSGDTSAVVRFASSVLGTTYTWTASAPVGVSGYLSSGSTDSIPRQVIINTTSTNAVVTYTITPRANGCNGASITYYDTIRPVPFTTFSIPTQTICSGTASTAVTLSSTTPGVLFAWTATTPSGVSGVSSSGTSTIPSQTIYDSTYFPVTINYVARATTSGGVGCPGTAATYSIIVNPTPDVMASKLRDTICSNTSMNIRLSSHVAPTTYSWTVSVPSGVTGASSGSDSVISQLLVNSTSAPLTVVYTVTPSSRGCTGIPITVSIVVNPTPTTTFSISNQTICSGDTSRAVSITSSTSGVIINWTSIVPSGITGASSSGTTSIPSQVLTNSTSSALTVLYITSVTTSPIICAGRPDTFRITVNPRPIISPLVPQTICSATSSVSISFSSTVVGTTYAWTSSSIGVTGAGVSGTGTIPAYVLTNTGSVVGMVIFDITPTAAGCSGAHVYDTIYVNPTPIATIALPYQALCSGDTTAVVRFASSVLGTTYTWTASAPVGVSGYLSSGSTDSIPRQVIINTTSTNAVVTYTITPRANGCNGASITYYDTIRPAPFTTFSIPTQTICSGTASTAVTLSSTTPGVLFAWTATTPLGVSGVSSSGTSTIPSQTIYDSTYFPVTINYVARATTSGGVGCPGTAATYSIIVNPTPDVMASKLRDTICSNTSMNIRLSSHVAPTTYSWTVSMPSGVTGGSSGSDSVISQLLVNSTSAPLTVVYTVTPSSRGCTGIPITVSIVVNPTPTTTFSISNQTICSGDTSRAVSITSSTSGVIINWTSIVPSGITGASSSGTTSIPSQVLTNSTSSALTVLYITSVTTSPIVCAGRPDTFRITVNPRPIISPLVPQTICSATSSVSISFSSTVVGTTYAWTSSSIGVTGAGVSGTGTIPAYVLTNTGSVVGMVIFDITPTAAGCSGAHVYDTIYVNPTPIASIALPYQALCSGDTTAVVRFASSVLGTTYTWTASAPVGVSGYLSSGSTDSIPRQVIINTTSSNAVVTYTITPRANGCNGASIAYYDTIRPAPFTTFSIPTQTICSGTASTAVTLSSTTPGVLFAWTATTPLGVSGVSSSGTSTIPSQTIYDSTYFPVTINYVARATTSGGVGCPGTAATYSIIVNPTPDVMASKLRDTICSNTSMNIRLSSHVSPTTYSWTVSMPSGVTGASSGSDSVISQLLVNSTSAPLTVVYTVTPSSRGCTGIPITVSIVVNPTPITAFSISNQTICSGDTSRAVSITSSTSGVIINWTSIVPSGITGASSSGTTSIPSQILSNSTSSALTVLYITSVTTSPIVCSGRPDTFRITVNPRPIISPLVPQTICSATSSVSISFTSSAVGTTYSWSSVSIGVTGAGASGSGSIPAYVLTNTGSVRGMVVFDIIPTAAGCSGAHVYDTIYVNPTPIATIALPYQALCSGDTTAVVRFASSVLGTTYTWTASAPIGVSGYLSSGSTDSIPRQVIINTTSTNAIVTYTITPRANGCNGASITYYDTIRPVPITTLSLPTQTICSGNMSTAITLSSSTPGVSFSWTSVSIGVTGVSPASGTGNIPAFTLTTLGTVSGYVVFTSYASLSGCNGPSVYDTIYVNPTPIATIALPYQALCSGDTTAVVRFASSVLGTTYTWTASAPIGVSGYLSSGSTDSIPRQVIINTTSTNAVVTYTITPRANGCNGASIAYYDTIRPAPFTTFSIPTQTICSGTASTAVTLSSTTPGVLFAWTATTPLGVSGVSSSGTSTIPSQTIYDSTYFPVTINYVARATTSGGVGCPGTAATYSIIVNPTPDVMASKLRDTICSNTSMNIRLSSHVSPTTYSWTVSVPSGVTGASSGSDSVISQLLVNSTSAPLTVVYTVTPSSRGCTGIPITVSIVVNPTPTTTFSISNQTICSGDTSRAVSITSSTSGVIINWSSIVPSGITGASSSGTTSIPSQVLTNSTSSALTVLYITSVTTSPIVCAGRPDTFRITVNPLPIVTPASTQTICSGDNSSSISHTSSVAGSTFSWTSVSTGVTGVSPASGTGTIPIFTIVNTGSIIGMVVFTVRATASGCVGLPITDTIYVNPSPIATIALPYQVLCSGDTSAVVRFASSVLGTTYTWTASAPIGVSGYLSSGSTDSIPRQVIVNTTSTNAIVTYTITPRANGCNGASITYYDTIRPAPFTTFSIPTQTICSGTASTAVTLSSTTPGVLFAWTSTTPLGVSGVSSSGTSTIPSQTIYDSTYFPVTINYVARATTSGGVGCPGTAATYSIIVNPTPDVMASKLRDTICSNTSMNIRLSSHVSPTTYSWTVSMPSGVTGASSGSDSVISQLLVNSTSAPLTVVYTVTPSSRGCTGIPITVSIVVNPTPTTTFSISNQTICSGDTSRAVSITSSTSGVIINWTSIVPSGITGASSSGTTSIPSQVLTNSTSSALTVLYTTSVTTSPIVCAGRPDTFRITVNPRPIISPLVPQTICSATSSVSISFSSTVVGTTYAWTSSSIGVTGAGVSGTGTIPAYVLTNTGSVLGMVIFDITPTAAGCSGAHVYDTIYVNPTPIATIALPYQALCSGDTTAVVRFASSVLGTTYTWTASAPVGVSGYLSSGSTDSIPRQVIINTTSTNAVVTYTITPRANGCNGAPITYYDTIRPVPITTFSIPTQTICSGTASTAVTLSSTTPGVLFAWTSTTPLGVSGVSSSGTSTIPSQTIYDSTYFPVTINYVARATTSGGVGCPGTVATYSIIVNPTPDVMASKLRDTICSNTSMNIRLSSHVSPTTYSWTVSMPSGVTGGSSGSDSVISQLLVNSTSAPLTVVYTITPSSRGCTGIPIAVSIVVNPTPRMTFSLPDQTICSGELTSLVNINTTTPGSIISWRFDSISGITGTLSSGSNIIPVQRIYSSNTTTTVLNYNATISYDGCVGISDTYQISITPRPDIHTIDSIQTICTEDSFRDIVLSSDVIGTTYRWYALSGPLVTGFITTGIGNVIPAQALFNAAAIQDTLRYIIQPSYNGCSGDSLVCFIIVLPRPSVMAIPDTQELCSGLATTPIIITSTISGTRLRWNATATDVSGYITTGTSDTIPSRVLTNTSVTASQGVVNYSIYPVAAGCSGDTAHATILLNTIPIPNFMPSAFEGCSPLTLGFATNTLLLGTIDSIVFDWGDTSSNLTMYPRIIAPTWPAATHIFYNDSTIPITYNITLRVYNSCGDSSITRSILVRPNTVEAFFTTNAGTTGCEPFSLNFTDLSSGATTSSWCFDYYPSNDSCAPGSSIITASGATINHTYNAGTYTVRVYVTDGCSFDTFSQVINVYSRPVADFIFIDSQCSSSAVPFTNTSTPSVGSVLTSQNWYFGDGDSSNSISPTHVYANGGNYNVCLIVYSSLGCSDTICKNVYVNKRPEISIISNNTCFNQQPIRLFGVSVPADTSFTLRYNWSLGDGNTSTTANPIYSYASSGTYALVLIANDGICIDTANASVQIYPIVDAAFSVSDSLFCDAPQTITITNASVGAVSYAWDFGNGDSSFLVDPIYTYLTTGTFQIQLIAESNYRCLDTAVKTIEIVPRPVISSIDILPAEGCQPLQVDFNANVLNASSYVWNFGDGLSSLTTSSVNQSNLYNDTGIFSIVLYAYANPTCMDSLVLSDTIIVHENPISDFSYVTGDAIGSNGGPIIFTNLSQGAIAYSWNFGDGAFSAEVDPTHRFIATSDIKIILIAENIYGCKDTSSQILCHNCGELFVPNAFAPAFGAGSDLVKIWKPAGYGLQSYLAQIFNTYGELLWSSDKLELTQPAEGWDGTYEGKAMPQDVYVWKIEAIFIDGSRWKGMLYKDTKVPKTIGDVTLIR